jgi:hypothetical protein
MLLLRYCNVTFCYCHVDVLYCCSNIIVILLKCYLGVSSQASHWPFVPLQDVMLCVFMRVSKRRRGEGGQRGEQRVERCLPRVLQECYKSVTRVLQESYRSVTRVLQEYYKSVTDIVFIKLPFVNMYIFPLAAPTTQEPSAR